MEVAEEGSSDSEEVVFFNSQQPKLLPKGSAVKELKLKEEVLARSNKIEEGDHVCQSKQKGREHNSVKGANLSTLGKGSGKQMMSKSLKNTENSRRCEIIKEADNIGAGYNPQKTASPLTAISKSLLDDSLEFAKHFNADVNFVHAKFAARKPLGLRVQEKRRRKVSCSRLKLERVLLHADIVAIKQSLDMGGAVSARSGGLSTPIMGSFSKSGDSKGGKQVQVSKKRKPDPLAGALEDSRMSSAAPVFPATESKVPALEAAPFVHSNSIVSSTSDSSMLEGRVEGKPQHSGQKPPKPAIKKVAVVAAKVKPLPKPPKPAVMFPSIKKLAFKIPRERKKPESLAVRVGKLWQEAISVDPTGQWCGAKRVAVRKSSRSLLQYESWLKVGRNEDIADWREGRAGQRSRIRASAADPLGLQQLSDSSENLTSRNGSSIVRTYDIVSKQSREKEEGAGRRPALNASNADVSFTRPATGFSSSRGKPEGNGRLPTLPETRMSGETSFSIASPSVIGAANIGSQIINNDNARDQNRSTGFIAERVIANPTSSSLAGMSSTLVQTSAQHLSQMDTTSPRLESVLESLVKEQRPSWQDASFSVAKEQLVEEYFFGQSNREVEVVDSSSTSDCSSRSSPKSSSRQAAGSVEKEYGRRAVFVVLTGGHTKPAAPLASEAKEALLARAKEVEEILNTWQPSHIHISSAAKKVRLDAIYASSSMARAAFKAIHDQMRSRTAPSLAACCMVEEEDLGYDLVPVLTESQLLRLQSAKVSMNVFLTFLPIKVVSNHDGEIEYHFKSVADVNLFLFRTQAARDVKSKGKGLGYLVRKDTEMNVVLVADTDNFYKLVTEHKNLPEEVLKFRNLRTLPINAGAATIAHLLLFPTKLRMFEFLVSLEARQLSHLQFYDQLLTSTTSNMQRVSKYLQGVGVVGTEAHRLRGGAGDAEEKCERLEKLLREKECEARGLQMQLEKAKVAVMEANAKMVEQVIAREAVEKQLEEIHQVSMSMSSSFLE